MAHDDLFPQDTDDQVWLEAIGDRGSIVLTKDDRIRFRPAERQALLSAGVPVFVLRPSHGMTGDDIADVFVRALPKILALAGSSRSGFVKSVDRRGRIRHLLP